MRPRFHMRIALGRRDALGAARVDRWAEAARNPADSADHLQTLLDRGLIAGMKRHAPAGTLAAFIGRVEQSQRDGHPLESGCPIREEEKIVGHVTSKI